MTSNYERAALGELLIASNSALPVDDGQAAATTVPELAIAGPRQEIVFIEDNVPDIDNLIRSVGAGKEIVLLDASRDGLQQIVASLSGRSGIDAVHIVSHGAAGTLNLGQLTLDASNLNAHDAALQAIGGSLAPGADILLYGCEVGAGEGADFVDKLAIATGADVAASSDLTGGVEAGGDWELEVTSGAVETKAVVDAALAAHYAGVLKTPSGPVTFVNSNFLVSTDDGNIVYKLDNDPNYQLVIDGQQESVYRVDNYFHQWSYTYMAAFDAETEVSISFAGGQMFSITGMRGSALNNNDPAHDINHDQTLLLTGYFADEEKSPVQKQWSILANDPGVSLHDWYSVALSGFDNIVRLTITAVGNDGLIKYLALDDLDITDIRPAVSTPSAPEVVSVTSSSSNNKLHKVGDTFEISVVFDQAVDVDTTNGTPTLQLATGNPASKAVFTRASDANTLIFSYTVLPGDQSQDLSYASVSALDAAGGSIRLAGGTVEADLALPAPDATGSLNANSAIQLDGVAPTVVSIEHNVDQPLKAGQTATFTITFSEQVQAFTAEDIEVSDNAGTITSLTPSGNSKVYTATFTPKADIDNGTATISVRPNAYTDLAGNLGAGKSSTPIAFDTRAPAITVPGVTFSEDSGIEGDLVTNEAAQTIRGVISADLGAGEKVQVSLDGTNWQDATTAGRAWELATALVPAKGTLQARVVDTAGNTGPAFSHAYEYDAVAPAAPSMPDLDALSDTGDLDNDNITGDTTPTFTGTAETGATVTLYADGEKVGEGTAGADGKWSITVDTALEGGDYAFTARATDLAGNQGEASSPLDVTIITTAPDTRGTTLVLSNDSGDGGDRITNQSSQTLSGDLSAALRTGEKVQVYIGGEWKNASAAVGASTWSLGGVLVEGEHEIQVRVVNAIGNPGPVEKYAYTLDTQAPTVAIESDKPTLKAGETATITFTFTDAPGAAFTEESIKVTGGELSSFEGSGLKWTAVFTPDENTNGGQAGISIDPGLFSDLAGNSSGSASLASLTFDTMAPTVSEPMLAASSDLGWSEMDRITADATPTFTGTAETGATVTLYDANGNAIGSGTAANGTWSITPTIALVQGRHTISARAVDSAGNESAAVAGQEITIDTTAPTVNITSNTDKLKIDGKATITFTFSEDPGSAFTRDTVQVSGGTLGEIRREGPTTFTADFTPTDGVDLTTASITIAAGAYEDEAGNKGGAGTSPALAFDTKAPPPPSVPDLDAVSDTGDLDDDNITGDTTPTFIGTAETGATVRLFDGGLEIGSAVATDGTWSIASTVTLGKGEHFITAIATDSMGNHGPSSDPLRIEVITDAPTTRVTSLEFSVDTGVLDDDLVTQKAEQLIRGSLDAALKTGEYVEVSVDGGKTWQPAEPDADGWSIETTLVDGKHAVSARVVNAIGNKGTAYSSEYHLDTEAPGVTVSSDVKTLKRGETATITFTFTEDPGATFTWNGAVGDVSVSGGTLSAITGSGTTRSAVFTPTVGFEGSASITVHEGGYTDAAGNFGKAGATPQLTIDTQAPEAPDVPTLAPASDTGEKGDGRTGSTTQLIEGGGALAGAWVTLYDGNVRIDSVQANDEGKWSIEARLGGGTHALSATQADEAGNESAKSDPFTLTVTASNPSPNPNPTPTPPTMVDGMPVVIAPVSLPGGVPGTSVAVPIVTGSRNETDGEVNLADIPLASSGGQTQLLAQLPVGYGLSSSGASVDAASGLEFLIASIKAATPTHVPDDQGHLVQNGTAFLQGLDYGSLLVHTVKPVSIAGASAPLVLSGTGATANQGTALVIETGGLAGDAALELVGIDFAAVVGTATVGTGTSRTILSGDGASQHFTVIAGNQNQVFAGAGSDVLSFAAPSPASSAKAGSANGRASAQEAAPSGTTTLHGGQGDDAATFTGVRSDYDLDFHNGHVIVSSKASPDAKALVVNVEELRFADGNVKVEDGADLTTLAGLYQTTLGRQADMKGFEFWADARDAGVNWGEIAMYMIASGERLRTGDDFNGDADHDVGLLYQALFNRDPDAQGLAFWTNALHQGMSLEQVTTAFVESAEMVGHRRAVLDWDFFV